MDREPRGEKLEDPDRNPPSDGPLVNVDNVTLGYEVAGGTHVAVSGVELAIESGETVTLLGPSGCGKSTLLMAIAGYLHPLEGTISIEGRDNPPPGPDRAMVFQEFGQLFPWRTVLDNVAYPLRVTGTARREARDRAKRFVELTGLSRVADRHPHQLSGGMKQRVAIARALALDPAMILMDEPFGSLDAMTRLRLQDELISLASETEMTTLFVTHSIEEAIRLGDRIVVMTDSPAQVDQILTVADFADDLDSLREQLRDLFLHDDKAGGKGA